MPERSVQEIIADGGSPFPNLHPWRRYFARSFDLYLFFIVFFFFLGVTFPRLFENTGRVSESLFGIFGTAAYALFDGFWTNIFGNSPGKRLYGIRLVRTNGGGLDLGTSLRRSFTVYLKGLGLGIPLVSLITLIVAYNTLTSNGQTSWDRDLQCTVVHSELSALRWTLIVVIWVLLIAVYTGLVALGRAAT